ncbi:MAG: methylated-DNA--[protein]-cysteine S-methyltransferase [Opitutales bacterium]|nr:methylated-DNA--[protein]-cysteine S-methyltransferase [Opitutales bacterium]
MNATPTDVALDAERVSKAIQFIRNSAPEQPGLKDVATAVHLSEFHLQRLFSRWAGISPKRFLQLLTLEHAKAQLAQSQDVLNASLRAGLSGSGRLHDLFVNIEAVTPGEFKMQGKHVTIDYGFHPTPFGECMIGVTKRGICFLEFSANRSEQEIIEKLRYRWPESRVNRSELSTKPVIDQIFATQKSDSISFNLLVKGTNFQLQVWNALLKIPAGYTVSYSDVAKWIGKPKAHRAVGSAIGNNPIAWLIPCHRVLRSDGNLGGYHWGEDRKSACLTWEGRYDQ